MQKSKIRKNWVNRPSVKRKGEQPRVKDYVAVGRRPNFQLKANDAAEPTETVDFIGHSSWHRRQRGGLGCLTASQRHLTCQSLETENGRGVVKPRYLTGSSDIVEDSEQTLASAVADYDRLIDCTSFVSKKGVQLKVARAV